MYYIHYVAILCSKIVKVLLSLHIKSWIRWGCHSVVLDIHIGNRGVGIIGRYIPLGPFAHGQCGDPCYYIRGTRFSCTRRLYQE